MEDENTIFVDTKLNNEIRSYKEFDNVLYTIGIDNLILGLIKISSVSSEKEESNQTIEESYLNKISDIIPLGSYINGCLLIYNENTFEDFESVLTQELDKIKKINKNLILNKPEEEIKYAQLALKELLYLDDEDELNFEFKKYGDKADDDFDVIFEDNLIEKYFSGKDAKYKFIIHKAQIVFKNQALEEYNNIIEIKKEELNNKEFINNILDEKNNKEIKIKFKEQNLILNEDTFNKIEIDNFNESNKNINKLNYAKINLVLSKNNGEEQVIENIKITDLEIKEDLKSNIYIEIIGIISQGCETNKLIIETMLSKFKNSLNDLFSEDNKYINQKVVLYNYLYNSLPYNLVTLIPINITDNKIISISNAKRIRITDEINISKLFNITGVPFYDFCPLLSINTQQFSGHILNPHLNIGNICEKPKDSHIIRALVRGDYYYYHYNQDNFIDSGWGCAYRSLQTLISWFILNTSVGKNIKIPTIPEIQTILVKLGDKDKKIIGSNEWIGAIEVNLVLNELLGIDNQILYVSSGSEINSKGRELLYHFRHNGTPVMVGGGVYAYTILGVDYDKVKGECKFLILDPHFVGEDDIKTIINKGWCNWKNIDIFKKENFYNLCLPLAK